MTETDWLTSTDPEAMLSSLQSRAGERSLRLFACACMRRYRFLLRDAESRHGVEVAERFAEGMASRDELRNAHNRIPYYLPSISAQEAVRSAVFWATADDAYLSACRVATTLRIAAIATALSQVEPLNRSDSENRAAFGARQAEENVQAMLLREVFANPFVWRPSLDSVVLAWNNGLVRRLAQVIAVNQCWAELPILADALLDAGCSDEGLLQHCRQPNDHVRGCWAIDHILATWREASTPFSQYNWTQVPSLKSRSDR
jgi:hypothetical protein